MLKPYIFLLLLSVLFFRCSSEEFPKTPTPTKVSLIEKDDYTVEQIYEGTNKYNPTAVIVSTKEKYNEASLSKIKEEIIQQKLTKSDLVRTPFIMKNEGKVYGVLFHYYAKKERRNDLIPIDTLRFYVNKTVEKMKNSKGRKIEIIDAFAHLGHFATEGYKKHTAILGKDLETGFIFWERYKIDMIDGKYLINTEPEGYKPFYEFEIKRYDSGDAGFYSHKNKGLHNYYLKVD